MACFRRLGRYQKGILLFMAAMALVFAAVYSMTISKTGFAYKGAVLVRNEEDGGTVYSGQVRGQSARFTVHEDGTVEFQCGETAYGPYTAREDPSAIPEDNAMGPSMTGVELRRGEDILFRGGVMDSGDSRWLFNEDGSWADLDIVTVGDGTARDDVDPLEPSAAELLDLMAGPELAHKGEWLAWFGGAVVCVLNGLTMLFADELFRWNMSFRIRNAGQAEPSDWEIAQRYIGWTVLSVLALVIFIAGLQ